MKILSDYIIFFLVVVMQSHTFCQGASVKYSPGFDFTDGIYLSYEEFKNNTPSIKMRDVIVINPYPKGLEFINKKIKSVEYRDQEGRIWEIKAKHIWGLCNRNKIYIRINNKLHMLIKIGAICYFIEDESISLLRLSKYHPPRPSYVGGDAIYIYNKGNYIFNQDSGNIFSFTLDNFENLIINDNSLYNEFKKLEDDETKSKILFQYLDMYNLRNPIYFPVNRKF